jgi:hypothetical protein
MLQKEKKNDGIVLCYCRRVMQDVKKKVKGLFYNEMFYCQKWHPVNRLNVCNNISTKK